MRDKQVDTCLSNLDCVTVGGIISTPHPISRQSLSDVLQPSAPPKYSLSAKAAAGILRRAGRRGRSLPETLRRALETVATGQEADRASEDGTGRGEHLVMAFSPHHDSHDGRPANFKATNSAPTLRGPNGTDNMLLSHHFGVRRLTPVECERLQGFPDNHTAGQSDSTRYRQLGNAVAVPVAEWIGRRIIAAHNGEYHD